MATQENEHTDVLDQPIKIGDVVACADHNSLQIGMVHKINPKMIGVKFLGWRTHKNKYPKDIVVIEGPLATLYLLKHSK
jgi:hypothetical protein